MSSSVTWTERLKFVSAPAARLASTNSSTSGWSQRSVAIMAPRRAPVDSSVAHIASQMRMNETGPEAMLPRVAAAVPRGRSVEKSTPMPPPHCIVTALRRKCSKIASIESSMKSMTKQLNSVTSRAVPAPARMRPAGRKRKSSRTPRNACAHGRASRGSTLAAARATRSHVSPIHSSRAEPSAGS